jgi:hypothetical protein
VGVLTSPFPNTLLTSTLRTVSKLTLVALVVASQTSSAAPASSSSTKSPAPALSAHALALPPQTVVFDNARLAQREGRPLDVLKLWLLRNALVDKGEAPIHDAHFRSLVWAALGETGLCPDGFIEDDDGAGLWPIAVHNWLLKNQRRQPQTQPEPWSSFRSGVQQRPVSLFDVLSFEELRSVRFARGRCLIPWVQQLQLLVNQGSVQWVDMDDRLSVGLALRDMLKTAQKTLRPEHIDAAAVLRTRLFDLDAALLRMQAQKARQETSVLDQALRGAGVAPGGRFELRATRDAAFGKSPEAALWREAFTWTPDAWLTLREDRRLSLFADADRGLRDIVDDDVRHRLMLGIIDALIEAKDGPGLIQFLGFVPPVDYDAADFAVSVAGRERSERLQRDIALGNDGRRGERLLALDVNTGFRERSAIALRRGVFSVGQGDLMEALRSFAFALAHADESRDPETMHRLTRRWLAFVLSQYSTTDEVIAIVERFVPAVDYPVVVDSLLWRAAFHADVDSFEGVCASAKRRKAGSVGRLCDRLRPLVLQDPVGLWAVAEADGDAAAIRFAERLVDEVSSEPLDVRHNQRRTLEICRQVLDGAAARSSASLQKKVDKLRGRLQALLDGIDVFDDSVRGRIDGAAPDNEAYAGSVRLAPADPLPWPFSRPQPTPPNPFTPIVLRAVNVGDDAALRSDWIVRE